MKMNTSNDSSGELDTECVMYECKQCHQTFSNKTLLAKHMFLHREGFICMQCNKPFASESGLRRHKNANHKVAKPAPYCIVCGQCFRIKRDLEKHHLACHRADKFFKCKYCGAEFSWLTNLQKHEHFHVNTGDQSISDKSDLFNTREESSVKKETSSNRKCQSLQQFANEEKTFQCHVCGKEFQFDFSYAIHLEGHKKGLELDSLPYVSESCIENEVEDLNSSKDSADSLLESTPITGPNKSDLLIMKDVKECVNDVSFVQDYSLRSNGSIDEDDDNIELFQYLKECKLRRKEKIVRKRRPESPIYDCVMTEEKPFKCHLCGESFRWEVSLAIHAKMHADGKALKLRKIYQKHLKPVISSRKTDHKKISCSKEKGCPVVFQKNGFCEEKDSNEAIQDHLYSNKDTETSCTYSKITSLSSEVKFGSDDCLIDSSSSLAKADKFLERMSSVLKSKWNPADEVKIFGTTSKIESVGQAILMENNKKLPISDSKLLSEDGTQFLVSDGLLYMMDNGDQS